AHHQSLRLGTPLTFTLQGLIYVAQCLNCKMGASRNGHLAASRLRFLAASRLRFLAAIALRTFLLAAATFDRLRLAPPFAPSIARYDLITERRFIPRILIQAGCIARRIP